MSDFLATVVLLVMIVGFLGTLGFTRSISKAVKYPLVLIVVILVIDLVVKGLK